MVKNKEGRRQSLRNTKTKNKTPLGEIGETCPLEEMNDSQILAIKQILDDTRMIHQSQSQLITSTPIQNESKCTKCKRKDITTAKLKKKHIDELENLKNSHITDLEELQNKLDESNRENVKLREQLLMKTESNEIEAEKLSETSETKEVINKQEKTNENKREHTNGEDTKNDSEMDTESDIKDDSEDNEEERGITRVENCQTKNIKIIENKFEVCKDRNKCDNETVEVGVQCKKLHLESEEHEKLKEDANKLKENEINIKKQKAMTQYCKHHLQNRCMFQNSCWKKHVSPREYKKTIRCRFYEEGGCRKGSYCEYKHMSNTLCRYYAEGTCARGEMCTYRHMKEKDLKNPTPNMKENKPISKENKERKASTSDESKMEQNFLNDKRGVDQMTMITQLAKSLETIQTQIEILMEKSLGESQ